MAEPKIALIARIARTSEQEFLSGLMQYVRTETNWTIRLIQEPEEFSTQTLDEFQSEGIDGIITAESGMPGVAEWLESSDIPLVVVGSRRNFLSKRRKNIAFVTVDEERIGRLCADFFLSLGSFRTFSIIDCGPTDSADSREYVTQRQHGFASELRRHRFGCNTPSDAELQSHIGSRPRPHAILTRNEQAIRILNICQRLRLKIPEQVSILVLGNNNFAANCSNPSLSSIDLGSFDEGCEAGRQMTRLLAHAHTKPAHILTESEHRIYRRETTAPLKPAAHLIEKALDYIRQNAGKPITVNDITRHLGVSRRLLDLRFREYNDATAGNAIRQTKLETVCRLLSTTRLPIDQIARQCGFPCKTHLMALFKKRYHETMSSYRQNRSSQHGTRRPLRP